MKKVLIYLDPEAAADSLDLLEVARQLYPSGDFETYGLAVDDTEPWKEAAFDVLIRIDAPGIGSFDAINLTNCIEELQAVHDFDAILVPATCFGRMLAPRVAMRLRVGLVAEVTEIHGQDGEIQLVRPAFSGRLLAEVKIRSSGPLMLTVGRGAFKNGSEKMKEPKLLVFAPWRTERPRVRVLEKRERPETGDIRESDILVSGGGGAIRYFNKLEALAEALGGRVAASRKLVDGGIAPRQIQVGQSGKTVSPRLYMAIGISGSIQHVSGLRKVNHVIAVNSNRYAPICGLADIVVEGDARDFVEKLLERIEGDHGEVL